MPILNDNNYMRGFSIKYRPGFTLAELLIALAILGVIATFTIPKILQSQQNSQIKSVAKESYASISQIMVQGWQSGELKRDNFQDYFFNRINALKFCPNDASAEGCWDTSSQGAVAEALEPGFILPSGAVLTGFNDCCCDAGDGLQPGECDNGIYLDSNGPKPPNVYGEDQYSFGVCFGKVACTSWGSGSSPGRLHDWSGTLF